MNHLTMRARAAAAATARRLSSSARSSSGGSNDARSQETFFGLPPPGTSTTHFGFQTVAHELKEGLVAQVRRGCAVEAAQPLTRRAAGVPQSGG
jgi:hypothetical protein